MIKRALFGPAAVVVPGLWASNHHYADLARWLSILGFPVDVPKIHVLGGIQEKAAALAERLYGLRGRACVLICHSIGALVAHCALDLYPQIGNNISGVIFISGVSPNGFEPAVLKKIVRKYAKVLYGQLRSEEFHIPSLAIFQDLFGGEMESEDWRNLHSEDSKSIGLFMARSFFVHDLVIQARIPREVGKLFIAAAGDKMVTGRSLSDWRKYYSGSNGADFLKVAGSHFGVLSQEATFAAIGEWLDSHFTWYVPPDASFEPSH